MPLNPSSPQPAQLPPSTFTGTPGAAAADSRVVNRLTTIGNQAGEGQAAATMAAIKQRIAQSHQQSSKDTAEESVTATQAVKATSASIAGAIKKLRVDDGPLVKNAGVRGLLTAAELHARDAAAARQGAVITTITGPGGSVRGRL
jgi:hypothetical protein